MCYVNESAAQFAMKFDDFRPHGRAQFGIQIGKWFIHQENFGLPDHRPSKRDALALSTRKRAGVAVQHVGQRQDACGSINHSGHFW